MISTVISTDGTHWLDANPAVIVRADTEEQARNIAQDNAGDESGFSDEDWCNVWRDSSWTTCEELSDFYIEPEEFPTTTAMVVCDRLEAAIDQLTAVCGTLWR